MRFTKSIVATSLLGAFALTLIQGLCAISLADVLHFHNGKLMRGKVGRVTGDLIEFTEGNSFGSQEIIRRLHLSNRHDIVETRRNERFFGEIVYIDKFKVDIQTAAGMVKVNRLLVKNVVMGTPMEQPGTPGLNRIPVNPVMPGSMSENSSMTPRSNQPVVTYPADSSNEDYSQDNTGISKAQAGEDEDAIPAVNRNY